MAGKVEDLLAAPLGRQLLYATLGYGTFDLYGRCGLGMPPGTAVLTAAGSGSDVSHPRATRSGWEEVPSAEAREAIREMVAVGRWRSVEEASELEVLSWIAGETASFGFRGEDEWLWGLTAMAALELTPVAEVLCPVR